MEVLAKWQSTLTLKNKCKAPTSNLEISENEILDATTALEFKIESVGEIRDTSLLYDQVFKYICKSNHDRLYRTPWCSVHASFPSP